MTKNNLIKNYRFIIFVILFFFVILLFFVFPIFKKNIELFILNDNPISEMKKYNVIFCGTIRDCEKYIVNILNNIEICGKKFNDFCVVIYENDSKDNTRELLEINQKSNYYYLFEDNILEKRRTVRLANGRNKILEKCRELNKNNYYNYLIMLDMDDVNDNGKFVNSIESCFQYNVNDWDVLTGNQSDRYYDIWALRKKDDYDRDFRKDPNGLPTKFYEKNGLLEIDSAFGGIAIYKISSIPKECKYIGEYFENNEEDFEPYSEKCEHVDFNKCIKKNGGELFLNTDFLTN